MAAESSGAKWLMDLVRPVDVLMRTKLAFHWQRTLRGLQVSGDWLDNRSAALSRTQMTCVALAKLLYHWVCQGRVCRAQHERHQSIYSSLHHSITNVLSFTHFSSTFLITEASVCSLCEDNDSRTALTEIKQIRMERRLIIFYYCR